MAALGGTDGTVLDASRDVRVMAVVLLSMAAVLLVSGIAALTGLRPGRPGSRTSR